MSDRIFTARFNCVRWFTDESDRVECTVNAKQMSRIVERHATQDVIDRTKQEMLEFVNHQMLRAFDNEAGAIRDEICDVMVSYRHDPSQAYEVMLNAIDRLRATFPRVVAEESSQSPMQPAAG